MLLNICCAICSLPIVDHLLKAGQKPALYFYSPNIFPKEEYLRRLEAARKVASVYALQLAEGEYDHDAWLEFVKAKLPLPPGQYAENGERCRACFQYRVEKTAAFAKAGGFGSFATTLSLSRFKDTAFINNYGAELAGKNDLTYATFPLEAGEAHRVGLELSRRHGIYRQKYCGCEFSAP